MLMGIFTISTLAFIHKLIPDNSKAKKFIHATRTTLAQCTHSMWKSYRHFIVTANVESARHRVRKSKRTYYWNRKPAQALATPPITTPRTKKQSRKQPDSATKPKPSKQNNPGLSPEYIARMDNWERMCRGEEAAPSPPSPRVGVGVGDGGGVV
jgi:hypothetical protein